ncbi:cytochrome c maturation protein CcmE [Candidatus Symbiobacter mobilis]|uniref:Cytochrome c-type biogenesis protein CcmE n=1 Tax=Candidatus Symbiobacter mobilis CR TaxID=946483 RepID=U5N616_9BURK|nr:cytochrome c maturation protein CcmE [Candidatus Symbiobacter mobilis]AGX86725.1 cytochrome c-type biogenesis protein CcmE [Candidatus Symbiobacter mobilis CR]
MRPAPHRLLLLVGAVASVALTAFFVLDALQSNLVFYFTPSEVLAHKAPQQGVFRIGGVVREGSVVRTGLTIAFRVTDLVHDVDVMYTGALPDLFREGKGVVVQGSFGAQGQFVAREVLAKHDENYRPPGARTSAPAQPGA